MDKVAPFQHHFTLSLIQNPIKPTKVSPVSVALGHAFTSPETQFSNFSPPYSCSSSSSPGTFHFFDELKEVNCLGSVKALHARLLKMSNNWSSDSMAKSLISTYLKFGDFRAATMVFFLGFDRNYVFWSFFLDELLSCGGHTRGVLEIFGELYTKGVIFYGKALTMVLKICTYLMDSRLGLQIHADLIKKGFHLDVYLKCALMNCYGSCWDLESANQIFDEIMVEKEELVWNEAIMVNLKNERWEKARELFREMQFSSAKANCSTVAKMLHGCSKVGALEEGKQIHGYVLKFALESELSVCNSLITMYSRNNRLELARGVFNLMEDHNLSSWNSIISSYATRGYLNDALGLLKEMESSDIKPDIITWNCILSGHALHGSHNAVLSILRRMQVLGFRPNSRSVTSILQAVIGLGILNFGREIHGYVIRNGLDYDLYVVNSLLDMYVKHDCLGKAQSVFNNMNDKNTVAWNTLISGYSFKGLFEDARKLMNGMEEEGLTPNLVTWKGLISGYSIWGRSNEALALIHQMKNSGISPNVVSWTALISGSSQNGNYRESLEFFSQMQKQDIRPNPATISSLLRSCGGLSLLQKGKEIHCFSIKNGFFDDVFVATALIDMYSKSGNLKAAYEVFKRIKNRTLASWNSLMMGFAIYGLGKEVLSLFEEMLGAGILPDAITLTAVLSGCKNSGLVEEGWKYFDSMSFEYSIKPTIEHYSCMVDLLGRAGYLDEAWDLIQSMPLKPDATIWGALLGSCCIHKNIKLAEIASKKLFKLEPYNPGNYVLMLNLYAMYDRWEDVERIKGLMSDRGVKNGQVWSWIEIDQIIHLFCAEENHPDEGEIYYELYHLVSEMKKLGYKPDVKCVYQNVDDREKEKVLLSHTEKLAITYGLIKSRSNAPIRVIKNSRICPDCHAAAKYMSVVRNREIFLRDGRRFHHFSEGKCSCNDCW